MADRFRFDERGMFVTFRSRDGMIGKDLDRRASRVQTAAKRQVGKRTHLLERNIVKRWQGGTPTSDLSIKVGSWQRDYALLHHEGTRPHIIRPRRPGGMLRFVKDGRVIYTRLVHHPGTRPNRYLSDNLPLAVV